MYTNIFKCASNEIGILLRTVYDIRQRYFRIEKNKVNLLQVEALLLELAAADPAAAAALELAAADPPPPLAAALELELAAALSLFL